MEKEMDEQMKELTAARMRIVRFIHGFIESMSLKCVVELGIADIFHKNKKPMTLQELAAALPLPTVDMDRLQSLMRYIVHHMELFTYDSKDSTYGLNCYSECLLPNESFIISMALGALTDWGLGAWMSMNSSLQGGPTAFERLHGMKYWDYLASHPGIHRNLEEAREGSTKENFSEIVRRCGSWLFDGLGSLVDVGGGSGAAAMEITKEFPGIKCCVFDLPHEIRRNSEKSSEVDWVEGDMFTSVPHGDAILLGHVLHNWCDEKSIKILERCKEAIPAKGGKVIILETVIDMNQGTNMWTLMSDMFMMVNLGGKERTKEEWEKLIHNAGYSKCKITPFSPMASIIEAYTN